AVSVRSDEAGCQNGVVETTTIEDDIPVPEFPSPAVPIAMITGCIAVCALGRRQM
ncbi:MAG: hypothetical protein GKC04_02390, partial [Methanomicrobiales archaeon]|nr:hypothetical protein [Methanomicrobiales archaeon]